MQGTNRSESCPHIVGPQICCRKCIGRGMCFMMSPLHIYGIVQRQQDMNIPLIYIKIWCHLPLIEATRKAGWFWQAFNFWYFQTFEFIRCCSRCSSSWCHRHFYSHQIGGGTNHQWPHMVVASGAIEMKRSPNEIGPRTCSPKYLCCVFNHWLCRFCPELDPRWSGLSREECRFHLVRDSWSRKTFRDICRKWLSAGTASILIDSFPSAYCPE